MSNLDNEATSYKICLCSANPSLFFFSIDHPLSSKAIHFAMSFKKAETYWIAEYGDGKAKNKEGGECDVIRRHWKLSPGYVPHDPPGEIRFPIYLKSANVMGEKSAPGEMFNSEQIYFLTSSQLKPILGRKKFEASNCEVRNVLDGAGETVEWLFFQELTKDAAWEKFYEAQSSGFSIPIQKGKWKLEPGQRFDFKVKSEHELKSRLLTKNAGDYTSEVGSEKLPQDKWRLGHVEDIQESESPPTGKKVKGSDQELGGGVGLGISEEIAVDIQNGKGRSDYEPDIMEAEKPKTEVKINGKKDKTSKGTQGRETGTSTFTGVCFRVEPDPKDHPIAEKHFCLRPDHLDRIYTNGGREKPLFAHIDMVTLGDIKKGSFPWDKGVPYRDEIGVLKYIKMYDYESLKSASLWEGWYNQSTLGTDKGSWKTRYTDPAIKLTIVPVGDGRLTFGELATIFEEVVQDTNQECEVVKGPILGQILVSI